MNLETKLKKYLLGLDLKLLGLDGKLKSIKLKSLEFGESNLNYIAVLNKKKFVIRINMDPKMPNKSREEFVALKTIEHLKIAPRALFLDDSRKVINETFIILEYQPGHTLNKHLKKLNRRTIEKLAVIVAELHLLHVNKLKLNIERPTYASWLTGIKNNIEYIKIKRAKYFERNDKFIRIMDNTLSKIKASLETPKYQNKRCLIHGDICEQNVLVNNNQLVLIDWESVGLGDPAAEITKIFEAFGRIKFSDEQRRLFLKTYLKIRKDKTLKQRIQIFTPLIRYEQFVWAVMHVFEIGEKDMHTSFVKNKNLKEHLEFAEETFNLCKSTGILDKNFEWSAKMVFPKHYLRSVYGIFRYKNNKMCSILLVLF